MNLYILVGATTLLKGEGAEFYKGTAWEHFRKNNQGFRKAEKKAEQQNAKVNSAGVKVAGNENSDISDIISRVESKLREWQPTLRTFNFNVNKQKQAAAAVIEADREAVRAEQAAELTKFKALAETLAGVLPDDIDLFRIIRAAGRSNAAKAQAVHAHLSEVLRKYKEARDV